MCSFYAVKTKVPFVLFVVLLLGQVPGGIAAQKLSFSSYPGELFSDDDFYITGAQLVVLETTNHIYNFSIYDVSALAGRGQHWHDREIQLHIMKTAVDTRCHQRCWTMVFKTSELIVALITADTSARTRSSQCSCLSLSKGNHMCTL